MSYKRPSYTLRWPEGHARHELVVTLRGLSLKDLSELQKLQGMTSDGFTVEQIAPVLKIVSKKMIRWNLTDDDDEPVPTDPDTLAEEDFGMIMDIVQGWQQAATGVSADLGKDSTSGEKFPEESIPMETS